MLKHLTIYKKCLEQIQVDMPHIVDKSDNAGCYPDEVLCSWEAQWPPKNVGIQFVETIFNEGQTGKDQCDKESAMAKR